MLEAVGFITGFGTRAWLECHEFFQLTRMSRSALHFCLERSEKRDYALKLKLTHFVDDRTDVLEYLKDIVPFRYLFGPHAQIPIGTVHVADWLALRYELLRAHDNDAEAK